MLPVTPSLVLITATLLQLLHMGCCRELSSCLHTLGLRHSCPAHLTLCGPIGISLLRGWCTETAPNCNTMVQPLLCWAC